VKVDYDLTPNQVLLNVMEIAVKNKYAEPLTWHGVSNITPELC